MKTPISGSGFRSYLYIKILPALIGINVSSRPKFEAALHAPSVFAVIALLIGLRFRRLIGKVVSPLATGARRIIGRSWQWGSDTSRDGEVENGIAASVISRPAQDLRMPQISCDGAFPKVIFQTWKSKASLPYNYAHWSESLRRLNPDFEYILWDESDNRQCIEEYYT